MFARRALGLALLLALAACEADPLEVINNAPWALAGDDVTANVGDEVELDASASRDLDDDRLSFEWTILARPFNSLSKVSRTDAARTRFFVDRAGTYRFRLTVTDEQGATTVDEVRILAGAGTGPVCRVLPPSIDFGAIATDLSVRRSITIENLGTGTLSGTASLAPGCEGFSIVGNASYSLGQRQTATIVVEFQPTGPGSFECVLNATSCQSVTLMGREGNGPNCDLVVETPYLGVAIPGEAPIETAVTVTNIGRGTLSGTLAIDGSAEWSVVGSPAVSLASGASRAYTVRFTPTTIGFQSVTLRVASADCQATALLSATGLKALIPYCEVSSPTIEFGQVLLRQSRTVQFELTNLGAENLSGDAFLTDCGTQVTLESDPYFLLTNDLAILNVTYRPTVVGPFECTLDLDNITCDPITIRGVGVDPRTPECIASVSRLDFGGISIGSSRDLNVRVANTFTGTLGGVASIEDPNGVFLIQSGGLPFALGANEFQDIVIRFLPKADQTTYQGVLRLGTSLCDEIPLTGTGGTAPLCDLSTANVDLGILGAGDFRDFTVTVTNLGGGTLSGSVTESCPEITIVGSPSYSLTAGLSRQISFRYTAQGSGVSSCELDFGINCGPVTVTADVRGPVSFASEILPVLNNGGCSGAGCHGTWSYPAVVPSLVNLDSPPDSQLLLKASGVIFHSGGPRTGWTVGAEHYNLALSWIQAGALNN